MNGKYAVGIDLHKRSFNFCILDLSGKSLRTGKCRLGVDDLSQFTRHLTPEHEVAIEPVNNVHWFIDQIQPYCGVIHLAHPYKVRLIADSCQKSDRHDAHALADLLRVGYLATSYIAPHWVRELRQWVLYRQQLVQDRTRIKNRKLTLLSTYGILFPVTDAFGKRGRAAMEEVKLSPAGRYRLAGQLAELDHLSDSISGVEKMLREELADDAVIDLLQTIRGVGFVTAAVIRTVTGDINRFKNVKAFASFTGLIPASRQSADHNPSVGITHRGSKALRSALVQSAPMFMNKNESVRKQHARICYKKNAKSARVAVAHKLARIVYHVWKEERPYYNDNGEFAA